MGWWLATDADAARARKQAGGWIKRFDPRFWTVNFPRPMMAGVTTIAADALRVDAVFYRTDDLAGLIWEAADTIDHPLLRYETARDFRQCTLAFRWRSSGLMPLGAINGPTLTIEGRDASGAAKSWYVRLWNYAEGTPEDAAITLDFGAMDGGFALPADADPVWAGDVDRMFVSLIPPGYTGASAELPAPAEAWVELTEMVSDGAGSTLAIGDGLVPPHGLMIATGYDDAYNQTPARVLRQILGLGYRGAIDHYVGMSHYFRLEWNAGAALHLVSPTGGTLNVAAEAWHRDFLARAAALGFEVILSLSYELLDQHCWNDWKQRAADGSQALTGWDPPSTLLSPASDPATSYLRTVAVAFATLAAEAGPVRFQIGEPWWWTRADGTICLHDDAARAALGPDVDGVASLIGPLDDAQKAVLDAAGALLSISTASIVAAVRAVAPDSDLSLLTYLPTVLDPRMPDAVRANMPLGWASPAFDRLQIEDYDWVQAGDTGASARGAAFVTARLGYPPGRQDYFSGFVLNAADAATFWPRIEAAARAGQARGVARAFIWALPQVARDGFTVFDLGEGEVQAFDDMDFPLALGREASVTPAFSTAIVTTAAGVEQRNADWSDARLSFDAGPGVRSEADIATLIAFFRARRGAARAFRFRDPFDFEGIGESLGIGDGTTTGFPLIKRYGEGDEAQVRRITRPVAGSVIVSVGGVVYRASPGMVPSAIRQSDGFDVDTLDIEGALTHDAITADDLSAGRWDGAGLTLFATDWTDPAETLVIARGEIGDVSIGDEAFTAELRGPTALLERPVVEQTSPDCRAQLGDRRCRVDLAPRTRFARIVSVADEVVTLDSPEPSANAYGYGRLRWLDGDNAGLSAALASSTGATVTLRDPPPFAIAAGARVELLEGCDRLLATCRTRFANAANFRGEPYLPGVDLLTRYGTD